MKLYLVRAARAVPRPEWKWAKKNRPLSDEGERQAHGVAARLDDAPIRQIIAGPSIRRRETVEALAGNRGLGVEVDDRLDDGAELEETLALVQQVRNVPTVLCAGEAVITSVLTALGVEDADGTALRCQRGSIWQLEGPHGEVEFARYLPPLSVSPDPRPRRRIGVMDLGSTSFHLLVADAFHLPVADALHLPVADALLSPDDSLDRGRAELEPVLRQRAMLGLGAFCANGEAIPETACTRAVEAARSMRREAQSVGTERLLCVGTAILRSAANGEALAARLEEALHEPIRIVSGQEEARLVHAAVHQRSGSGKGTLLSMDLGGGSLELASGSGVEASWETSLPIGVTRLHAELVHEDPIGAGTASEIEARVRRLLEPHLPELAERAPHRCVAAGGTARALARIVLAERDEADAPRKKATIRISKDELSELTARLIGSTGDERRRIPTVQGRRADLLPGGALIFGTVLELLEARQLEICDWGLREATILEALRDEREPAPPEAPIEPNERSASA